jgi:hypothetical protein
LADDIYANDRMWRDIIYYCFNGQQDLW